MTEEPQPFTNQQMAMFELLVGSNPFSQEMMTKAGIASAALVHATLDGEKIAMAIGVESQNEDPEDDEIVEVVWTPLFIIPTDAMLKRLVIDGADAPSEPFTGEEE